MTWREQFRPLIASVIEQHTGQSEAAIRHALLQVRPHSTRVFSWPYKAWLAEIRDQLAARRRRSCSLPRRRRQKSSPKQMAFEFPTKTTTEIDLRSLGVTPIEDLVPRPLFPLPNCPPLFD